MRSHGWVRAKGIIFEFDGYSGKIVGHNGGIYWFIRTSISGVGLFGPVPKLLSPPRQGMEVEFDPHWDPDPEMSEAGNIVLSGVMENIPPMQAIPETSTCAGCLKEKPFSDFAWERGNIGRFCKGCHYERRMARRDRKVQAAS